MRMAGALISAAHLACGLTGWIAFDLPGALLLFGLCAALSLALALVASPLMQRPPDGDGGLGAGDRDTPPEPPWWPDFEREFRAHVARERTNRTAA
jgi:hypothetical protein